MNSKERFINALELKPVDRLPVTTHHVLPYYLEKHMNGMEVQDFFDYMGFDPILWIDERKFRKNSGDYKKDGLTQNENWRIEISDVSGYDYKTWKYTITTPEKTLSMTKQFNEYTDWVIEHLIKEKEDIYIIKKYAPVQECDVEKINLAAEAYGDRGLVRGAIPGFELFGQPGCWQDAACLFGVENLIFATFDDPEWVHEFLQILLERKLVYTRSLKGAKFDLLELGGGDASSTVISPDILRKFVIPYDSQIIELAHSLEQRIAYHTCGGMMPILEDLVSMKPDALETFTPVEMGGDAVLSEAKKRIGDKVCMIGGFDQGHYFIGCSEEETRAAVRKCFEEAGENGGFILSPSDHFFDADLNLLKAFVDEAKKCAYSKQI